MLLFHLHLCDLCQPLWHHRWRSLPWTPLKLMIKLELDLLSLLLPIHPRLMRRMDLALLIIRNNLCWMKYFQMILSNTIYFRLLQSCLMHHLIYCKLIDHHLRLNHTHNLKSFLQIGFQQHLYRLAYPTMEPR